MRSTDPTFRDLAGTARADACATLRELLSPTPVPALSMSTSRRLSAGEPAEHIEHSQSQMICAPGPRRIRSKHPLRRRTRGHSVRLCHVDERVARTKLLTLGRYSSGNAMTAGNPCSTTQVSPYSMHPSVTESCSPCMQILTTAVSTSSRGAQSARCPTSQMPEHAMSTPSSSERDTCTIRSVSTCLLVYESSQVLTRRLRPP